MVSSIAGSPTIAPIAKNTNLGIAREFLLRCRLSAVFLATSAVLGIASLALHLSQPYLEPVPLSMWATGVWAASFFTLLLALPGLDRGTESPERLTRWEAVAWCCGIGLVAISRMFRLGHYGLDNDEAYWIIEGEALRAGTSFSVFGFLGDQPSNFPAIAVALFSGIFPERVLSARLPGVFYSILNAALLAGFARAAFGRKCGLATLFLCSVSIWDLHLSRVGWNNISPNAALVSGMLYFGFTGVRRRSALLLACAGILSGIAGTLMYVAMLGGIALHLFLGWSLLLGRARSLPLYGVFLLATFVTWAPTAAKIYHYPDRAIARHAQYATDESSGSGLSEKISVYGRRTGKFIERTVFNGDRFKATQLWGVTLDRVVSYVWPVGLGLIALQIALPQCSLLLLMFLALCTPVILVDPSESYWREFGLLPSFIIFAARGFEGIAAILSRAAPAAFRATAQHWLLGLLLAVDGVLLWPQARDYFDVQMSKPIQKYESGCSYAARYLWSRMHRAEAVHVPETNCGYYIESAFNFPPVIHRYSTVKEIREALDRSKRSYVVYTPDDAQTFPKFEQSAAAIFSKGCRVQLGSELALTYIYTNDCK